jgi:hypothetical protein
MGLPAHKSAMLLDTVSIHTPRVHAQLTDFDDPLTLMIRDEDSEAELDFNQPEAPQRFGMIGRYKSTDR